MKINPHYAALQESYLFAEVAQKAAAYQAAHTDKRIIRLGIGDVTRPLCPAAVQAMAQAAQEMGTPQGFRGYGPYRGYDFLVGALRQYYADMGVTLQNGEIFISDGAKSDCGNIVDIFGNGNKIAVCDPVYPVYVDTNVMAGRTGEFDPAMGCFNGVVYMPCTAENDFIPQLPDETPDIIYLCLPNNPTGTTIPKSELQKWVDYALEKGAVILYDAAYEAYISEPDVAHSIYECEGAKRCAIEMRSFSKNAGFTGTRLGFTVIPKGLVCGEVSLNSLWARRHGTKFNGAPYIIQAAGEAVYSPEGKQQIREQIAFYMENARVIREGLADAGYAVYGGVNAPYIWMKTPGTMTSWEFFDYLLENAGVVGTPGSGFGPHGEGYFRLTAFGDAGNTREAVARIRGIQMQV